MKFALYIGAVIVAVALPFSAEAASVSRSYNWSGYVASAGNYTDVSASWEVAPGSDSKHALSANAAWIGIGGFNGSNNLIQTGTRTMKWNGKITYQAWYEILPAPPVPFSIKVRPGDVVSASITEVESGLWRITFKNTTTGKSESVTVPYVSNKSSVEWIVERPSSSGALVALTPFDTFTFTSLGAKRNGKAVTPVTAAAKKLLLIEKNGALVLSPSTLGSDGRSFTVTNQGAGIAGIQRGQVRAL